ncbi:MAG: 16S rRNA (cytidine(1402)-2'-O)-methyltransferase [Pseudomonadota bacterium]
MSGILYIVATPIGNLEDITLRAVRVLEEVDLIAAEDTRHTRKLLTHFKIHTKLTSFFEGNEREKTRAVIEALESGSDVALVSDAGTPCISDPGYPLLRTAIQAGIKVVPIPGPSALSAAISAAGLSTDRFTFIGFLPDKSGKRRTKIEELKDLTHTLVIYVSKWKGATVIEDCLEILGDRNACLCRELTKVHEEFVRGTLSDILTSIQNNPPKGEMTLVISG